MRAKDIFKNEIFSACIVLLLFSCELDVIPDEITFETTFGGTKNDVGRSVQLTKEGGYLLTGYTESKGNGGKDVYLIKTDDYGEIVNTNGDIGFDNPYGETADEEGYSVQLTEEGSYIITGYKTESTGVKTNVYLFKTVSNGNIESFPRSFGGTGNDVGHSVQQTEDGGYVITGYTEISGKGRNVYLLKTKANMFEDFKTDYGGPSDNVGQSVQQTEDGGYIITGYSLDAENLTSSLYLIKTDDNGKTVDTNGDIGFERYFGESASDVGYSVQQTPDGGYIIAGSTIGKGKDVYLIKTDANGKTDETNGNKVFERTYGGTADDEGYSVQQTEDGGYIIAGYTKSKGKGGRDVYLIKTNANGDPVFERTYGETADDEGYSVQQTPDGGYIITGYTESKGNGGRDVYLIKTNANGDVEQ